MEMLSNINIQFYLLAYIVGSIPFGLILAKVFAKVDIKKEGSGNIGATNVLRVVKQRDPDLAKKLSIATLALDVLKGIAVLVIANLAGVSEATMWGVAVFAVIGHCFSIFLLGEGGKGVATGLGVLLYMIPLGALVGIVVWAIGAKVLKISSLSSLIGLLAVVVASFVLYPNIVHTPVVIIALIILYKHSDNIMRLLSGEERSVV
jgi:glycerol-3-phosphate acyltransferase PlsY